jgi:hypothetical protein
MNELEKILATLAESQVAQTQLLKDLHTKAPAGVQTAAALHGNLGMFAVPGLEPEIFSTVVTPEGLMAELPRYPSVYENPFFGALTGISDDIGNEPANPCDDAPTGFQKTCNLTAMFGRVSRRTETIEMDKVMLRMHRHDPMDLRLYGKLLGMGDISPAGLNEQQVVDIITMSQMVNAAHRLERVLCGHMWTGSPLNNNLGGGYKEFPGLDNQITTGQVDAQTNTSCPSLDSDVKDFAYNDVCGTTLDIVEYISMLEYYIHELARTTGMLPTQWVWVMRPQLWQELTACWPCKYNTNRCLTNQIGESVVRLDGRENTADRDRMRADKMFTVNGRTYNVVLDSCIYEHNNQNNANLAAGQFASSIYFVPLTVLNMPVTYMEYLDYRQAASNTALLRGREDFWTDRGMYSWAIEQVKWCHTLSLKTEMRVVLRTPQLAGKLQNVRYSPLQHLRDFDPSSPYHVDGGVSLRTPSQLYAAWLSR